MAYIKERTGRQAGLAATSAESRVPRAASRVIRMQEGAETGRHGDKGTWRAEGDKSIAEFGMRISERAGERRGGGRAGTGTGGDTGGGETANRRAGETGRLLSLPMPRSRRKINGQGTAGTPLPGQTGPPASTCRRRTAPATGPRLGHAAPRPTSASSNCLGRPSRVYSACARRSAEIPSSPRA